MIGDALNRRRQSGLLELTEREVERCARLPCPRGHGAAGQEVSADTRRPAGYASRCAPLLNPWRRMIFNRLE